MFVLYSLMLECTTWICGLCCEFGLEAFLPAQVPFCSQRRSASISIVERKSSQKASANTIEMARSMYSDSDSESAEQSIGLTNSTFSSKPLSYTEALEAYDSLLTESDLIFLGSPGLHDVKSRRFTRKEIQLIANVRMKMKQKFDKRLKRETEAKRTKHAKEVAAEDLLLAGKTMKSKRAAFQSSSDSRLLQDIWIQILEKLCDEVGPKGNRKGSSVARDLCNVSCVNKELYSASWSAFEYICTLCYSMDSRKKICTLSHIHAGSFEQGGRQSASHLRSWILESLWYQETVQKHR